MSIAKKIFRIIFSFVCIFFVGCASLNPTLPHLPVHKFVYFDPTFTTFERHIISTGFDVWTQATHDMVSFDLRPWPEKEWGVELREPGETDQNCSKHLLVRRMNSTDSLVLAIQTKIGHSVAGYWIRAKEECGIEQIIMVMNQIYSLRQFKFVSIHEFGHSLYLEHNLHHSIMNTNFIDLLTTLTLWDLAHLDQIK